MTHGSRCSLFCCSTLLHNYLSHRYAGGKCDELHIASKMVESETMTWTMPHFWVMYYLCIMELSIGWPLSPRHTNNNSSIRRPHLLLVRVPGTVFIYRDVVGGQAHKILKVYSTTDLSRSPEGIGQHSKGNTCHDPSPNTGSELIKKTLTMAKGLAVLIQPAVIGVASRLHAGSSCLPIQAGSNAPALDPKAFFSY